MQQNIHLSMPSEECRWCCYPPSLCLSLTWSGDMGESLSFMFVLQPQSLSLSAPLSLKCVIAMWNYISTLTHTPCLMFPFTLLNNTLGGARKKRERPLSIHIYRNIHWQYNADLWEMGPEDGSSLIHMFQWDVGVRNMPLTEGEDLSVNYSTNPEAHC